MQNVLENYGSLFGLCTWWNHASTPENTKTQTCQIRKESCWKPPGMSDDRLRLGNCSYLWKPIQKIREILYWWHYVVDKGCCELKQINCHLQKGFLGAATAPLDKLMLSCALEIDEPVRFRQRTWSYIFCSGIKWYLGQNTKRKTKREGIQQKMKWTNRFKLSTAFSGSTL